MGVIVNPNRGPDTQILRDQRTHQSVNPDLSGGPLVLRPLSPAPEPFCVGVVTQIAVGHPAVGKFVGALTGEAE